MELGLHALNLSPDEQEKFLDSSCGDDEELKEEVARLIKSYLEDPGFLEEPVVSNIDLDIPSLGRTVGPFRLIKPIGSGGMGSVYLATRPVGGGTQSVAIKLMREGALNPKVVQRFETEQRVLANLSHPNIARLIDAGRDETGLLYIAMEYVDGKSIVDYCDRKKLNVNDRLELFQQVAEAVHFAHQNLVVHRDLKPSNILVADNGTVKLLDFGIAKILGDVPILDSSVTRTRHVAMTPAYASPEQVRRETITTASDVYSLGVLLYELVAGHLPYTLDGKAPTEIADVVCDFTPPPPSSRVTQAHDPDTLTHIVEARDTSRSRLSSQLRGELDNIILKALRKEPARRYRSVADFDADIGRFLSGLPVDAQPDTLGYRVSKFVRRNRVAVLATALLGILLVAFSAISLVQLAQVREQSQIADSERNRATEQAARAEQTVQSLIQLFATANPTVVPGADTLGVREFLQLAEDRVISDLSDRPLDQARVRNVMGEVYDAQGNFGRSASLFAASYAQMQTVLAREADTGAGVIKARNHPQEVEAAMVLRNWAVSYKSLGKIDSAAAMLLDTEKVLRAAAVDTRKELARVLVDRAGLMKLEEIDEQIALFEEAHQLAGEADPGNTVFRSEIANSLASQYFDQGHYEMAAPMFAEVVNHVESELGSDHPSVLSAKYNLAGTLQENGQLIASEELWMDVIGRRINLFGENDRELMGAYSFLGANLWLQGRREEAGSYRQKAFEIATETLGREHPRWAANATSYGVFISQVGQYDEALQVLDESLALRRKLFGDESIESAISLWARGMVWYHSGDFEAAARDVSAALTILTSHSPDKATVHIANSQFWLGRCYLGIGREEDAYNLISDAREYRKKNQSLNSDLLRNTDIWLGVAASRTGRHDDAISLIEPHFEQHMDWVPLLEPARKIITDAYKLSALETQRLEIVKEIG